MSGTKGRKKYQKYFGYAIDRLEWRKSTFDTISIGVPARLA